MSLRHGVQFRKRTLLYGARLYMDFTSGTYFGKTAANLTVTRTTSGTALTSAGAITSFASGTARITDLGLLVEGARTNSVLRSEEFDNASWTKTNVTVAANSTTSPDAAATADTLTASAGNGTCQQGVTTTAISWTFSVWLKRLTGTGNVQITMDGTTWVTQTINSSTWTRCTVTQTGVAGTSNPGIRIVTSGDAVYAFGAQAEAGAFVTSYIPTTTLAVARNADAVVMSGTSFSDWYGAATALTLYAELTFATSAAATAANQYTVAISDTTSNNRIATFRAATTNTIGSRVVSGGSATNPADITSTVSINVTNKIAIAASVGTSQAITCSNGTLSTANSPAAMPVSPTVLTIGVNENSAAFFADAYIRKVIFIPRRMSNLELQALTI